MHTATGEHRGGYRDAARPQPVAAGDEHAVIQRALDARFGVTPHERDELAAGCMPPRLRVRGRRRVRLLLGLLLVSVCVPCAIAASRGPVGRTAAVLLVGLALPAFIAIAERWRDVAWERVCEARGPVGPVFADGGLRLAVGATCFRTRWSSTGALERGDYVRAYFDHPDREPLAVELIARAGERTSLARAELDLRFDATLDDFRARFR